MTPDQLREAVAETIWQECDQSIGERQADKAADAVIALIVEACAQAEERTPEWGDAAAAIRELKGEA